MKHQRTVSLLFLCVMSLTSPHSRAGLMLRYDFSGASGNQVAQSPDFTASGLSATDLTRGSGLNAAAGTNSISASAFSTGALDATDWFGFTLTPQNGVEFSLESMAFAERRSGTGIRSFEVRSSLDGFASAVGGVFGVPDNTDFRDQVVSLSGLTSLTSAITLRIYGYAAEGSGGTWRLANHTQDGGLTVSGSFNSVPEPSSLTVLAGLLLCCAAVRRRQHCGNRCVSPG